MNLSCALMNVRGDVTITDFALSPSDVACHGDQVQAGATIWFTDEESPICVTISTSDGQSQDFSIYDNPSNICATFTTGNMPLAATNFEVTITGGAVTGGPTISIFLESVLDVTSYTSTDNPATAVAVGQNASFHAELNNYDSGNVNNDDPINWAPCCLYWSGNVSGSLGNSWASGCWTDAGWQNVVAYVGDTSATNTMAVVSAKIKDLTFGGTNYADIEADDSGTCYTPPHWGGPDGIVPFQLAIGVFPSVTANFKVEPTNWNGPVYIKGGAFPTSGLSSSRTYSQQGTVAFSTHVGHDTALSLNWQFSVAEQVFFPAGYSTNEIYYTLNAPAAHYHTSVHTACDQVSGSEEDTVFAQIWGKFASCAMETHNGVNMFYRGANTAATSTPFNTALFDDGHSHSGKCGHWSDFMMNALSVHQMTGWNIAMIFPKSLPGYQTVNPEN